MRTNRQAAPFLTAQWLNLAIVNYPIEASVLTPYVPRGAELDPWQGRALVSIVGFQFRDARIWRCGVPGHRNFAEVNLRFYVRRRMPDGWRRGVVFLRELAPRRMVAWVARRLYGENYWTVPMRDRVERSQNGVASRRVEYAWRFRGAPYALTATAAGTPALAAAGSEAEFIVEHYWGYSGGANRRTVEYQVDHRRWALWNCSQAAFEGDVAALYGPQFAPALAAPPCSAYVADGSPVAVYPGRIVA